MDPAPRSVSVSFATALSLGLWGLLVSCSGNQALENRFAANPDLQASPTAGTNPTTVLPSPSPAGRPGASPVPTINPTPISSGTFTDVATLPASLATPIQDLADLGILTAKTDQQFAPQQPISRAEFSRWLFQANNIFFADQPSKQIRPAAPGAKPVFTDVPTTHPDFAYIQGFADAGLIPSSLTNDPSATLFRPDAPLTREDLLLWKVPLDQRGALTKASLDNIKETWGFQDAAKINPKVWSALYADFQSGDRSNLRRMFGFTTLLQPQKPVTRAEAATALWYLGDQTDGITAQDVLTTQKNTPDTTPAPSPESDTGQNSETQ
ncbi:MAG: S-layer homology domain-containing protein [Synechocystis sp.]|nr:S-layer homology domain-containing protein [Synechocystis sp.]